MKKGFTLVELIGVVIILGMIAILAFPPLLNMLRDTNEEISKANETLLLTAADQYTNRYVNDYPKDDGNVYCITYGDLIKEELISSSIPNKDGNIIDYNTKIKVTINNGKYEYSVDNSCKYVGPKSLVDILKEQYNETNTVGLLKDDTGYYYKGTNEEVSHNFVWFGGHLWRVVSIDNDDNITMITQQPITTIALSDSIWTTQAEYENSYINHWLNSEGDGVFYKSLSQEDRNKIVNSKFNVGEYNSSDNQINIDSITTTKKVGLLDEIQYGKAGGQNSFLDIKDYWLFGNLYNTNNSSYIRGTYSDGSLSVYSPISEFGIRPVIKITNLTVTETDGTLDNPYRENSTTTSTTNIKVGEYISIPTSGNDCGTDKKCLFRVVSKDNNSIKVILNGLLPSTSAFGTTATYVSGNTIDTVITTFANTLNDKYRYMGNKSFNIGRHSWGQNYSDVNSQTYTGTIENSVNVGLPVIGEMFTGNDIDMTTGSTIKTFVNINTIENPTVEERLWTMNANSDYDANYIGGNGMNSSNYAGGEFGVRPVLFLKNNLTFTGGEGTAENPFTLE